MSRTPRSRSRRRAAATADPPVVRVTTPAQVVAALPVQLGFTPEESLVVLCCHEPRGRIGLTFRLDLPGPGDEQPVVDFVEETVRGQEATRVVLVVYSDEDEDPAGGRARQRLMDLLLATFEDLVVTEALLVRHGRFFSYQCDDQGCCPAEGTPVDAAAESAAVQVLKLEQLSSGVPQVGSRTELEEALAGPVLLAKEAALQRCDAAADRLVTAVRELGLRAARRASVERWQAAQRAASDPRWALEADLAAALAVSVTDVLVRDAVAAMWVDRDGSLQRLLEQLARFTPGDLDAPVCTLLAWVSYCEGAGALTSIALERALRSDPDYSMALLLQHALRSACPPSFVREITRRTKTAVRDRLEEVA